MCVLRRERDKALAELERVTAERDEARAVSVNWRYCHECAVKQNNTLRARVAKLEAAR